MSSLSACKDASIQVPIGKSHFAQHLPMEQHAFRQQVLAPQSLRYVDLSPHVQTISSSARSRRYPLGTPIPMLVSHSKGLD